MVDWWCKRGHEPPTTRDVDDAEVGAKKKIAPPGKIIKFLTKEQEK